MGGPGAALAFDGLSIRRQGAGWSVTENDTAPQENSKSIAGGKLGGRIALVTGASRGIGHAAALALARAGAHVVALARNQDRLEGLDDAIVDAGGQATLVPLDLTDFAKLDALGPSLLERFGKLDIFIGNAARLGPMSPLPHVDAGKWDAVLAVNLTANFRLIRTLEPLLKLSDAGRAVFLTSGVTQFFPGYWAPYTASKAALEALVRTWADELKNTPVRVNLLDPGALRTDMRAQAFPGENPQTLPPPEVLAPLIVQMSAPDYQAHGTRVTFAP